MLMPHLGITVPDGRLQETLHLRHFGTEGSASETEEALAAFVTDVGSGAEIEKQLNQVGTGRQTGECSEVLP